MNKKRKKKYKRKSGQVMVEFVMVLGLYLFLLGFMFSGFQLMNSKMVNDISAFTGARYYSAKESSSAAYNAANELISLNAMTGTQVPKVSFKTSSDKKYITCTVESEVKLLFPMINPNNITRPLDKKTITSTFTMRSEK